FTISARSRRPPSNGSSWNNFCGSTVKIVRWTDFFFVFKGKSLNFRHEAINNFKVVGHSTFTFMPYGGHVIRPDGLQAAVCQRQKPFPRGRIRARYGDLQARDSI